MGTGAQDTISGAKKAKLCNSRPIAPNSPTNPVDAGEAIPTSAGNSLRMV